MQKSFDKNPLPFRVFLTGGAGTGKSHLIKAIFYEFNKLLISMNQNPEKSLVLVVAYTWTAAFNIHGQTIHSAFNIRKTSHKYVPLGEKAITDLRLKHEHLQLLIIDEISMVDKNMLNFISGRLNQIMRIRDPTATFGNICVLGVGDFYQLPPVFGSMLYKHNPGIIVNNWEQFQIWELDQTMRQKNDIPYAELLNRLRVKRKNDTLSEEDENCLVNCLCTDESKYPSNALYIYALNKDVDKINASKLLNLQAEIITINAYDSHQKRSVTAHKKISKKESVLPEQLTLAVGARVMLTVNLDVDDGLVNGARGQIKYISPILTPFKQPTFVAIKFDSNQVGNKLKNTLLQIPQEAQDSVPIKPYAETIKISNVEITKHQFPIRLAWPCTIHKTQGMTLKYAVISFENIFKESMAYVALSRVSNKSGLFLKDFDADKVYAPPQLKEKLQQMQLLLIKDEIYPLPKLTNWLVLFHNIQSLVAHKADFINNNQMAMCHVIGLSETWLQTNQPDVAFPGFRMLSKKRYRGGVCLYVRSNFKTSLINLPSTNFDALAVKIDVPDITVCVIYKKPGISHQLFNCDMAKILNCLPHGHVVLGGDYNTNILVNPVDIPFLSIKSKGF